MKLSSLLLPASAALLMTAAALTSSGVAQAPQGAARPSGGPGGQGGPGGGPRNFPAPTNLKVLPKDLTGAQVRDIMRTWQGDTGLECADCHTADPVKKDQNGKPQLNYADDTKAEKQMARIMYTMTEDMKHNYIPKVAALDTMTDKAADLTCGTCHRGKEDPEEFVPPKRPGGPGGPQGAPMTMPMGK